MEPVRRVVFVVNDSKPGAKALADDLSELARNAGIQTKTILDYPVPRGTLRECDVCCVIGGDGTLLSTVAEAAAENVPVVGVNMGKLGFLAMFSPAEARQHFLEVLEGRCKVSERTLLECTANSGRKTLALNDIVVRATSSRMARIEVYANDKLVNVYSADGIVFSTPTGSTAYNLSAGGPLIHPHAPVIAMTPICPHTLSNRSVIFSENTRIRVAIQEDRTDVRANRDGQSCFESPTDFPLEVAVAQERFRLILNPDHSHFAVVRSKLGWSGNHISD